MTVRIFSGTKSADRSATTAEQAEVAPLRPSGNPAAVLSWRVHPARQRPAATVAALSVVATITGLTIHLMGSVWWGFLPALFLLLTLQRFFLPTKYRLDEEGVSMRAAFTSATLRWDEIRRFRSDEEGAYLSRRSRPSPFDSFQGLHLLFDNSDAAEKAGHSGAHVTAFLTARLKEGRAQRQETSKEPQQEARPRQKQKNVPTTEEQPCSNG